MRKTISILLFTALMLAACTPVATPVPSGGGAPEQVAAPTTAPTEAVAQAAPTQAPPPTAAPTIAPTDIPQPTAAVIQDTRPVVDGFKVSDPATVNLAAGAPQFVEFFAFW